MKNKIDKKAISPLVATIMLVGLAIVAFIFIFTWTRGMISEQTQKFSEPIENWCGKVAFEATLDGNVVYVNNMASVPIYGMNMELSSKGGKTVKFVRSSDGIIDPAESDSVTLDLSSAEKIRAIPVLLGVGRNSGKGKIYACSNSAKVLK